MTYSLLFCTNLLSVSPDKCLPTGSVKGLWLAHLHALWNEGPHDGDVTVNRHHMLATCDIACIQVTV